MMFADLLRTPGAGVRSITFRIASWSLLIALWILFLTPAPEAQTPSTVGQWSSVQTLPIETVHVHMLPTGKVLFHAYSDDARLWDPATGAVSLASLVGYNIFCAGHSALPDGRLLVTGGHIANDVGLPNAAIYDPFTNTWTRVQDMNAGRWYPTNTTLANGDILTTSGNVDLVVGLNTLPQVWDRALNRWRDLLNARKENGYYPYMHLAPDGRVFMSGSYARSMFLNTSGSGGWTDSAQSSAFRDYGSSVLYDEGKVLYLGGSDPPLATAEVIDLKAATPSWRPITSMANARRQMNATILADGTVLVTGGSSGPGFSNPNTPVYASEIWNPTTESWSLAASAARPRLYHSAAVLLPDGRVFSSGGQGEENAEVYSPPYLFKGTRPTITSAPTAVAHGQIFFVATPNATSITKVHLIKLSSVTHGFNQDQRINRLQFSQASGGLNVTVPANGNLSPPGYYMLFIVNGTGVPSVASIIRVGPSGATPAAPAGLTATAANAQISLTWQQVNGASAYKIFRSTTSGSYNFTTPLATVPSPSYLDSTVSNGTTYYYTVRATNGSGDSPSSNEASATPSNTILKGNAVFVRSDTATQGNWSYKYGSDGYLIANLPPSYPAYAQVSVTGAETYTWEGSTTDPRALLRPGSTTDRIASTMYSGSNFTIDVRLTDGQPHWIALYCVDYDFVGRRQTVDVIDPFTNARIDSRILTDFTGGVYLVWQVTGHVQIRVAKDTFVGTDGAVAGLFVGPANDLPSVTITSPAAGSTYVAPANVVINATATTTTGSITKVEFFQGTTKLGEDLTAPYSVTWPNAPAGRHTLTAKATMTGGATALSPPIQILVAGATASATYVRTDTTTKGNWRGTYGADGYAVIEDSFSLPSYANVYPSGHASFTWASSTTDIRALQRASGTDRIAATWYSNFSFDLEFLLTDNQVHQLALYCLDWDTNTRIQRIDVFNWTTGELLDTRTIQQFNGGQYLIWNVSGRIVFRITHVEGWNGVVEGIFFGGNNAPPSVSITAPTAGQSFTAPATVPISATASDTDGSVKLVEFFQGTTKLGEDTTAPYSFSWTNVAAGNYSLTARATDNIGATTTSAAIAITVTGPNAPPSVSITAPADGATFTAPATITINANATDTGGSVTLVEFFQGSTKLGEDATASYSFSWQNVPAGSYVLTARATDNTGATTTSAPVGVTVNPLTPPAAPTQLTGNDQNRRRIRLNWNDNASNESGFRIERSLDGTNFTEIDTRGPNTEQYTDDNLTPNTLYYYRVRAYNAAGNSAYSNVVSVQSR
jgi:hypothetical protein